MTEHDLRVVLWNIHNNNKLICFPLGAHKKITNYADRWQPNWAKIFDQILEDMMNGEGYPDKNGNNKNGMYWELPIGIFTKEWMVVFFRPPEPHDDSYLIYDFEIVKK